MLDPTIVVALSTTGALGAAASALWYPRLSLGILFLLASFSRATLETPLGTMRPEMPAIAAVAVVLLGGGRLRVLVKLPRAHKVMALTFGAYLGVLALSSAVVAPDSAQSLRMVAWLAISMAGGVVAYVLMQPRPTGAMEPLAFAGAVNGAIGIALAVLFLAAGPDFDLGIQDPDAVVPRVHALGWEANLYASFLAMTVFFALETARGPWQRAGLAMLAVILVAFPLGITRGAYFGLAAGALAYATFRLTMERRPGDLPRVGAIAMALLVTGVIASNILLPNAVERNYGAVPGPSPTAAPGQTTAAVPSSDGASATSSPPTDTGAAPVPTLDPYPDTLAFRLERVPIALDDLRSSPLIGFGAESFGQRHPDRYAGPGPDHIAILAVVAPYEAGFLGAASLAIGFAVLLASLWRSARLSGRRGDWPAVGMAAAFAGSLVCVLVAYQVTNAVHLALNWIVIGAAAALTARDASRDPT